MKKPIRVLIIEDSDDDMELVLTELRQGGFEPDYRRVEFPEAFQNALEEENWQLILCEYSMPEFDGLTALRIVKKEKPEIPFFLISDHIEEEIAIEAMKAGVNDFIFKDKLHRLIPAIEREFREAEIRKMHHQSEIAIKKSEQRLRKAQQIAKLGHWEFDHLQNKIEWSKEVYKIFNIDRKNFDGSYSSFLDLIHPEDRQSFDTDYKRSLDNNESFELTFRLVPKENCIKYVHAQCENIFSENGALLRSVGVLQDVTRSVQAQIKIHQSLAEKQVLLAEVHHRVKNNMAIISGLLQLGLSDNENEKTKNLIQSSVLRIKTMMLIHEKLYSSADFSKISFKSYTQELLSIIETHYKSDRNIELTYKISDVELNINQAIPVALILNELVTNAYKHAFTHTGRGEIEVCLYMKENRLFLAVNDNGIGLPENFNLDESQFLGLTMVHMLAEQLKGDLAIDHKNGTHVSFQFEVKDKLKGAGGNFFPSTNGVPTIKMTNELLIV